MSPSVIIDAGPALNFFSINKERLLISVTGRLKTTETVEAEVLGKADRDPRFKACAPVWRRVWDKYLEVLADDADDADLSRAVTRLSGLPMPSRSRLAKDLGELMVIAHAAVFAEAGHDVTVLIDDDAGQRIAANEAVRLRRLPAAGPRVGNLYLLTTAGVLQRAAGTEYIPHKAEMRKLYDRLRALDDGLIPIGSTNLLSDDVWR